MVCHIITECSHHLLIKPDHSRMALQLLNVSIIKSGAASIRNTSISDFVLRQVNE